MTLVINLAEFFGESRVEFSIFSVVCCVLRSNRSLLIVMCQKMLESARLRSSEEARLHFDDFLTITFNFF